MHATIADSILDIVQNSIEAGAEIVTVDIIEADCSISVCIGDNGKGMDAETLKKVRDPFYTDGNKHSSRSVGLGIPFVEQGAIQTGGEFDIRSEPGEGTSVFFKFKSDHLDCPPTGDIPGSVLSMMLFDGDYELQFSRSVESRKYSVLRSELIEALGSIHDIEGARLARNYIVSQEEEIV